MTDKEIAGELLDWYDTAHRSLPWRVPPGSTLRPDPYRVWLSEIMLQQTTVAAVVPYFETFTSRWPTVAALAAAADGDVMAAWAGLGYYARARNLLASARVVMERFGGRFPADEAQLRTLPGVGTYTAAAIAAIGFGLRAVVVDGNVERVVARLFGVETPLPAVKAALSTLAGKLTPAERSGDFAQAMMDLGATVCRPKAPACPVCPLHGGCTARALGIAAALPRRAPKSERPVRFATAYWLRSDDEVLTVRRPPRGLLGGMAALPLSEIAADPNSGGTSAGAPASVIWDRVNGVVRHVFTHFELRLTVLSAEIGVAERPSGTWVAVDDIADAGLPTVFRKAASAAIRAGRREGAEVANA